MLHANVHSANYFRCAQPHLLEHPQAYASPIHGFYAVPTALSEFHFIRLSHRFSQPLLHLGFMLAKSISGIKSAFEIGSGSHSLFRNHTLHLAPSGLQALVALP